MMVVSAPFIALLFTSAPAASQVNAPQALQTALVLLRKNDCTSVGRAQGLLQAALAQPDSGPIKPEIGLALASLKRRMKALACPPPGQPKESDSASTGTKPTPSKPADDTPPTSKKTGPARSSQPTRTTPPPKPSAAVSEDSSLIQEVLANYDQSAEITRSLKTQCSGKRTEKNAECKRRLGLAKQLQAELAFEALRILPERAARWRKIRQELGLVLGPGLTMDAVEDAIVSEGLSSEEAVALLKRPREKLLLANQLAEGGGSAALWKEFVKSAQDLFEPGEMKNVPSDAGQIDWALVFAHLRALEDKKWEILRRRLIEGGMWDPHQRRDPLLLLFVLRDSVRPEEIERFTDTLIPWLQRASPEGSSAPVFRNEGDKVQVRPRMLELAEKQIASDCKQEPSQPNAQPQPPQYGEDDPFARELRSRAFVGLLVVELSRVGDGIRDGGINATASWVRRTSGCQIERPASSLTVTLPPLSNDGKAAEIGVIQSERAQKLAEDMVIQGRLFPNLASLLPEMKSWRVFDKVVYKPVNVNVPVPVPTQGNPWHAFLFAGLPYLEDSNGGLGAQSVFSTLDVLTWGGGMAAMAWSIEQRKRFSEGDRGGVDRANDWLLTSEILLVTTLAIRSSAAICYSWERCRRWTQK